MPNTIAFLRGMNLGNRRITNDELGAAFRSLGFEGVATYRASGNVLFDTPAGAAASAEPGADASAFAAIIERVETGLRQALGYEVPTILRTASQLAAVVAAQPFTEAQLAPTKRKIQVTFYRDEPTAEAVALVAALHCDADRLHLAGRDLYWLPTVGISTSELDHRALDKALGLGTTRTLGTVANVVKKCGL